MKNFIKAYNFNKDEVYNKCIWYKTPGDVFAADIYVHKNCVKKYIKKYLKSVEELFQTLNDAEREKVKASEVQVPIDKLCLSLDLVTNHFMSKSSKW